MEETIMTPKLEEVIDTPTEEVISEEIVPEMPDADEGETTPEELPE